MAKNKEDNSMNKYLIFGLLTAALIGCAENPVSQPDIQEKNDIFSSDNSNYTIIEGHFIETKNKDTIYIEKNIYHSGFFMFCGYENKYYNDSDLRYWFDFENGFIIGPTIENLKYKITLFK